MGKLLRYMDGKTCCWSRVDLENGDPVWIIVAQAAVVVKKSRVGLMGTVLYKETDLSVVAKTAQALDAQVGRYLTPKGMANPALRAFTQAALECASAAQLSVRLNTTLEQGQTSDGMSDEDKEQAEIRKRIIDEDKEQAEIRKRIISEYGNDVVNHPRAGEIQDVSELPYTKQEILDAIALEIVQEIDDKKVDAMITCGMALADFQDNVGPKPLRMNSPDNEKYLSLCKIASKERASIYKKLMAVKELRQQMLETKKNAKSEYEITTGSATEKDFFCKLANGDFGLARTYWLYGVLVGIVANMILNILLSTGSRQSLGGSMIFMLALTAYEIPLLMGTWRAADKYQGEKIWAILAKISVVLGTIGTILLVVEWLTIIGRIIGRLNQT